MGERVPHRGENRHRGGPGEGLRGTMPRVQLTLSNGQWLATSRDGLDYLIEYSFVDADLVGAPEETSSTRHGHLHVGISGTLLSCWGHRWGDPNIRTQHSRNVELALIEYGRRYLKEKAENRTLGDSESLDLSARTHPEACPFDPSRIRPDWRVPFTIEIPEPVQQNGSQAELATEIITLRDQINVIARQKIGSPLLTTPEERNISALHAGCSSSDEFALRTQALSNLVTGIDPAPLRAQITSDTDGLRSMQILDRFLDEQGVPGNWRPALATLRNLHRVRHLYPAHTDHSSDARDALAAFGIGYPVQDFASAWGILLTQYRDSLRSLLQTISSLAG